VQEQSQYPFEFALGRRVLIDEVVFKDDGCDVSIY
jgi:hypothetical protein